MAELNLRQITDKLNDKFQGEGRKLIFWYDDNAEFEADIDTLELDGAKVLRLEKTNQLYIKYYLEIENKTDNFLLYAPFPKPDKSENHLLDILHYSNEFFIDRASLICADLSIPDELKPVIQEHIKYFDSKERNARFYALDIDNNSRTGLETAFLSALCKLKVSSFEECMRVVLSDDLDKNKYIADFEKYGLLNAFWQQAEITFGFTDAEPNLEKLLMCLFLTYTVDVTKCDVPVGWKTVISHKIGSVKAFLDNMMNHTVYGSRFDELSDMIYKAANGNSVFRGFPIEDIVECCLFKNIDEIIIEWITAHLENEDTAVEVSGIAIPELCLKRRRLHFNSFFRNEYFVLENAYYIIKDAKYDPQHDVEKIAKSYTDKWYKIDMRYRYFNLYYDRLDDNEKFEKLRQLIENIYTNDYLNKLAVDWSMAYSEAEGKTTLHIQQDFYRDFVVNSKGRVCVIISDAMRYEVGVTLFEQLEADEKCSAEITPMLTVLPSKTQTGMAALLPHSSYTLNSDYKAVVDGKLCDDTETRNAQVQSIEPSSKCVQFDDIFKKTANELREIFAETKFVYVYHNQIDNRGDNAKSEDEVFVACEEAVKEIKTFIRRMTTSVNTSFFIVTADHGFIYKRDKLYESDKISGVSGAAAHIGKRYALSETPIEIEGIRSFPLADMYSGRSGYVSSPVGTDIIKAPGSGLNFVHGGCSIQEMIVPVIEVKTEKSFTETKKATIALVTPLKTLTNLNVILEFVQSEPVSDVVKEATYRVYFASENGETISNENFIIADKTDSETIHRLFKLRFSLKNKAYNKADKHYLVAIDEKNGAELIRSEIVIDIAFAGNFGF